MDKNEQRIIRRALRRRDAFLTRFSGIPGAKLQRLFNSLTPGVNWYGCTKGRLADAYAVGDHQLNKWSLDALAAKLGEIR